MRLVSALCFSLLVSWCLWADPPIYAPKNSKVEIDNAWVRVLRVNELPGENLATYRHPDAVRVYLSDTHLRFRGPEGIKDEVHKTGEVSYLPAGAHSEENASEHPVDVVVIELKPGAPKSRPVQLDPTVLDPEHHPILLENARVRAIRTILEPHLKSPVHEHPHYVVVYITELHTSMKLSDGRVVDNPRHPGDIAWRDALQHVTENIDEKTAMEIQVEIK